MTDTEHDVFSDETTTETPEPEAQAEGTETEAVKPEPEKAAATEQEGEETTAETPAAGDATGTKSEKMIPESRFKAALKDVGDKLNATQRELATMKAQPAPDRTRDPDGYERHVRIETSKAIMQQTVPDYDEAIAHFQEMAKANPVLNDVVANAAAPAKMAYDLAKRDKEITELSTLRDSDDWKQFQTWKASQGAAPNTAAQLGTARAGDAASRIPNLNRTATASKPSAKPSKNEDSSDELFKGHYSTGA